MRSNISGYVKDEYTWFKPGGDKLLKHLHSSCLSDSIVN
jgi:hypothetical protein